MTSKLSIYWRSFISALLLRSIKYILHFMSQDSQEKDKITPTLNTVKEYMRVYGSTMDGNDQKAVKAFCQYETHEKLRRLQTELQSIKNGGVLESTCNQIIGKRRQAKYNGYEAWASLMLMWIVSKKK